MQKVNQVEDMPVYQSFMKLAVDLEKVTRGIAPDFRWLRLQALRSSESVTANMSEGFYSQYSTEYLQALYRCRREARETISHLAYGANVGCISRELETEFRSKYEQALMQLAHLIRSIHIKIEERGKSIATVPKVRESSVPYWLSQQDYQTDEDLNQLLDDDQTI